MTDLSYLTRERVLELLREVVAREGADTCYLDRDPNADYRYFHRDTGEPLCIVGCVLALEGVGPREVEENASVGFLRLNLSKGVVAILADAQTAQDAGWAWGEILRHVEKREVA